MIRAHEWLIPSLLALSTLGVIHATSWAQPPTSSAKAIARCRQEAARAGISAAEFDDIWSRLTPSEIDDEVKSCQQASVPSRSVDLRAVERGRTLYSRYGCAFCHGNDTRGGEGGPSLLRSLRVLRDQKGETIGEVVLNGVPGTAMAAFPLKLSELADISEFLHSFRTINASRRPVPSVVTGNSAAGEEYFNSHCANCHSIAGDLRRISNKYPDPQVLQQAWLSPRGTSPVVAQLTASGQSMVEGELLRLDEFNVTLGFADGTQRTFGRADDQATLAIRDPLESHIAMLPSYTDRDIHDVTAYLVSLTSGSEPVPPAPTVTHSSHDSVMPKLATVQRRAAPVDLTPAALPTLLSDTWPTYSGDFSGRRYSLLTQINQSNVARLSLAWSTRIVAGAGDRGPHPLVVAGTGGEQNSTPASIRGAILEAEGILFLSTLFDAWAVDAHDGHVLWHFNWKSRGGAIGNRGLGMKGNALYWETADNYLVSLDARTGRERWHVEISSFEEQYFSGQAPIVVDNHVLVGTGNILNAPGFLQSFDPESGKLQWKRYMVPMNPGDPGLETWKDLDAARHGGGMVWVPGAYDPDTHLYIFGTGNPTPAYVAELRGNREALFTCSLVAVDVDTGRMAWYYQTSPNDTHDWDSAQTPVLADLEINGRLRKVAMTAARNGYFFVVDRITGEHLVTGKFSDYANWARDGLNSQGQPVRIPEKDSDIGGALVSSANAGAANWPPPSYDPDYELFYVPVAESWAMYYKTDDDKGGANSLVGKTELGVDANAYLKAIDPKTGKVVWSLRYPRVRRGPMDTGLAFDAIANGILTTAGRLLFAGDTNGNLVARDPSNGHPLWHAHLGSISNAPETYSIDGHQYVLVAASDMLYAFSLQARD